MTKPEMPRSTLGHGFRAAVLCAVALVSLCIAIPMVTFDVAAEPAAVTTDSGQSVERPRPKASARPKVAKPSDPDELAFKAAVDAIYRRDKSPQIVGNSAAARTVDAQELKIKNFVFKRHFGAYRTEVLKNPASRLTAVDLADLTNVSAMSLKVSANVNDVLDLVSSDIRMLSALESQKLPAATSNTSIVSPAHAPNPRPSAALPPSLQPHLFGIAKNSGVGQTERSGIEQPNRAPIAAPAAPMDPEHLSTAERVVRANFAKIDMKNFFQQSKLSIKHKILAVSPACEVVAERLSSEVISISESRFDEQVTFMAGAWAMYFSREELEQLAPVIERRELSQASFTATDLGKKVVRLSASVERVAIERAVSWTMDIVKKFDFRRLERELGPDLAKCFPPPAPATRN